MGIFEDIDEEHDDTPEEINEAIYVKTINGKTISTRYYENMAAAVILEEVERRTIVPRDMIRLVHKGKMISGKKSMKENNIEAKETIEMSLRLLGGMDVSEQMDTHETEEDREKKRKLDEGKERKMTKPNDDMAHLKRDIMEALRRSDEKLDIRSVQQSVGRIVDIEDNNEENDNMPEEIHEIIYVKMINGKTISTRHHRNMTAAVILDEVERRSLIPRDMICLVHKGKMISEKKSMKENNIEAKETIEMSLRLLGGMEKNEQVDTHETEEDREKKGSWTKDKKEK